MFPSHDRGGYEYLSGSSLRLYIATAEGLNEDTTVEAYPISGAWNMGTGKYLDNPITTNGCSWQWFDFSGSRRWPIVGYNEYVTASMDPLGIAGGATWWFRDPQTSESISISQTLNYSDTKDLNLDVLDVVKYWYSSSKQLQDPAVSNQIINNGFIIKQTDENEFVYLADKSTELKYFSIDTNTIYPPQLEFKWIDSQFDTGSSTNTIITNRNLVASLQDNPGVIVTGKHTLTQ